MNKINLDDLIRYKDYLIIDNKNSKVIFSTAEEGRSFNRHTEEGLKELENLKKEFNVSNLVYLNQIHSDIIYKFDGINGDEIIASEGDAIITDVENSIIGIFTADCVPVILVDERLKVAAAIHSGWKGTFTSITAKTIQSLEKEYGSRKEDIKVYIGAHIRQCCYEVSEELKEKFISKFKIEKNKLFNGRNLSMEECILKDLKEEGIKDNNIYSLDYCTHCSKEIKLHSYRASKGAYGRLFTFVILR
ncbi:MAG: peptidoglycan editing factor PgeF [Clostridiaceae bacterium]|nr:peptidoglycan editing factor PgeF [Clostridiaceae bacterium]